MKPETKLTVLDRAHVLTTVTSGALAAVAGLALTRMEMDKPLTGVDVINLGGVLAVAYLVAFGVDNLLARAVRPRRERLRDAIAHKDTPEYPVDVAIGIEAYLSDLRAGLPLAVEMAGPEGEMPQTGDEWVDYRLHPYRLDALEEWHSKRAA